MVWGSHDSGGVFAGTPAARARATYRHEMAEYHSRMAGRCRKAVWMPWYDLLSEPAKPRKPGQ